MRHTRAGSAPGSYSCGIVFRPGIWQALTFWLSSHMQIWLLHSLFTWSRNTQRQSLILLYFSSFFSGFLSCPTPLFFPFTLHFFQPSFLSLFLFNIPLRIREKLKAVPGNLCCIQCGWLGCKDSAMAQSLLALWPGQAWLLRSGNPCCCSTLPSIALVQYTAELSGSHSLSTLSRPRSCNKPEWGFLQPTVQSPGRLWTAQPSWELISSLDFIMKL